MLDQVKITALVENTSALPGVAGEWGLSLWIETNRHRILFDTGQGPSLVKNAHTLGVHLSTAQAMVISHGHYDHIGGVANAFAAGFRGSVYLHPAGLKPKYKKNATERPEPIGPQQTALHALRARGENVIYTPEPTRLAPDLLITGTVPRTNPLETTPSNFFLGEDCTILDPLIDDQALLIETGRGWALFTGCGHSGVINLLHYAKELTGGGRICAVIGGFHLQEAPEARLQATAAALLEFDVELVAPCHCTDSAAIAWLQKALGQRVITLHAGQTLLVCP